MNDQAASPHPAPPPLRIHHLFACVTVAAMLFAYWRFTIPVGAQQPAATGGNIAFAVTFATGQIANAVGLTFAVFSLAWHFKGYAAFTQPGQWLLVSYLFFPLRLMWGLLYGPILRRVPWPWSKNVLLWTPSDILQLFVQLTAILVAIAPALLFAWCAWKIADTRAWRTVFAIIATGYLLAFIPVSTMLITRFGVDEKTAFAVAVIGDSPLRLLLILWAGGDDWLHRRQRVWTHWLGTALSTVIAACGVAGGVLFWLRWP